MTKKRLIRGNQAIAEAAVRAGCKGFFGYPITPQNHIPEYLSERLPEVGGVFLQAESEIAAINMIYGAGATGKRVLTSSSGPGISLKQEGISYIACAEVPCVIVNMMRGGPGLGGIRPAQEDYLQATKGGGHGNYKVIVLAPSNVQQAAELTMLAFDLADKYRNPVMLLGDGLIGQIMEAVKLPEKKKELPEKSWAINTDKDRSRNVISSSIPDPNELEKHNKKLVDKYKNIESNETRYETFKLDDAEIVIAAYGTAARICKSAIRKAREKGIKVGMLQPITLWPFPKKVFEETKSNAKAFLTVELSAGQMIDDVEISIGKEIPSYFYGRMGGVIPMPEEIIEKISNIAKEVL